jgi:hypothetical protein
VAEKSDMATAGQIWTAVALAGAVAAMAGHRYITDRNALPPVTDLPGRVNSLEQTPTGAVLAMGDAGLARFETRTNTLETIMAFPNQIVLDVACSDDLIAATVFKPGEVETWLHVIDAKREELMHTIALGEGGGGVIGGIANGRVAIIADDQVHFVDIASGTTVDRIRVRDGVLGPGQLVGGRLYLTRSQDGGLAVIDATMMQFLSVIEAQDGLLGVGVTGDTAFVWGSRDRLGVIDLKRRTYKRLELPAPEAANAHAFAVETPDVYVLAEDEILRLSDTGELRGRTPIPPEIKELTYPGVQRMLVDVHEGVATLAIGKTLMQVRLETE